MSAQQIINSSLTLQHNIAPKFIIEGTKNNKILFILFFQEYIFFTGYKTGRFGPPIKKWIGQFNPFRLRTD